MSFLSDIAGNLIGGVLGFAGQSAANSANASAAQADRDFQKEVLQNRHQWEADDYEKAGFNRILSVTSSSGGTGSNASIAAQNPMEPLAEGISSAVDNYYTSKKLKQDWREAQARIGQYNTQQQLNLKTTDKLNQDIEYSKQEVAQMKALLPLTLKELETRIANNSMLTQAQIAQAIAAAGQSSAASGYYDEQRRGLKISNDGLEKLGEGGKFINDVAEKQFGPRGGQYFRSILSGLPSFDWSPEKEFRKHYNYR
jgi:hypothetical protein